jgi:copper resistance protein C
MMTRIILVTLLSSALALPAFAHAHLKTSDPAQGATVTDAPKQLAVTFTEKLEPAFSGVAVTDAQGHDMEAGKPAISDVSMTVLLKPLTAGVYRVAWHAVAVDTHRTEGTYDFTVKP